MEGSDHTRPPLRRTPGAGGDGNPPRAQRRASGSSRGASSSGRGASRGRSTGRPKGPASPKRSAKAAKTREAKPRRVWRLILASLFVLLVALVVTGIVAYSAIARQLPDPTKQLHGSDQTSRLLDRNGTLITRLFAEQNRTSVSLKDMPRALQDAVVSTEDMRFYQHTGVDPLGIARAMWTDASTGRMAQGGSTITQQYVKNAFTTDERTLKRKVMEAMLAYEVERKYSKDKILEMYLNTIYFGHGAYGVETAAQVYFGKPVGKLDLAESAMLAGIIKSPGRYSPHVNKAAAKARRHTVLTQMLQQGHIDQAASVVADAAPFRLAPLKAKATVAPYFVEYVKSDLIEQFGADAVFRGGLTVHTTLDLKMQSSAEKAVTSALGRKGDPSAALVAIDPASGEVRAMVGGSDFGHQQYNVAVQGHRQPGSAFKPFVLVSALEQGVSPERTFESGPVALTTPGGGAVWKVTGAGGDRSGPMRLREATEKSVNSVFAQLILQIGVEKAAEKARKMGIATPVLAVPAIALGGLDEGVSPLEMASAYGTLADGGVHVPAHGIAQVTAPDGHVLFRAAVKGDRAVSAKVAYLATDMLEGVITKGTGTSAGIGRPAAGKTGTTQAYRDAWFAGYTPQLVASVWVGYTDSQKEMTSVHGRKVTGGSFPAQIWADFMRSALSAVPEQDFHEPDGLTTATLCLDTGLLATGYCPNKGAGLFLSDSMPKTCTVHTGPKLVTVPSVVGMTSGAAQTALTKDGFVVSVAEGKATTASAGTVLAQDPPAGTKAREKTTVMITVAGKKTPQRPVTAIMSFAFGSGGLIVTFDGSSSKGPAPLTLEWDFGDGHKGVGKVVSHTYGKKGSYTVTLRVTAADGRTASFSQAVKVE